MPEGQQRGTGFHTALTEFSYLHRTLEKIPLLLADDVLGELMCELKANFKNYFHQRQCVRYRNFIPSEEEKSHLGETFSVSGGTFSKSNP